MFSQGQGVPQNNAEAIKWYSKAANLGYTKAQFNLGFRFYKGVGVPKDVIKTYVWWSVASASGNERAKRNLEILRSEMTLKQVAQGQNEAAELRKKIKNLNK